MKYVYECLFTDKPVCEKCMLAFSKMGFNDETHKHCAALGIRPKCPEKGCRKDCPLKKVN
jgi:hypothetical protein